MKPQDQQVFDEAVKKANADYQATQEEEKKFQAALGMANNAFWEAFKQTYPGISFDYLPQNLQWVFLARNEEIARFAKNHPTFNKQ